jgi:hypothetical protein
MKQFAFILMLLPMVGCSTYANSTYKDNSTADQRAIEATGAAAIEAAKSNTDKNADIDIKGLQVSHNTHHNQIGNPNIQMPTAGRYVVFGPNGKRDHRAELKLLQNSMHNRNGRQGFGEYTRNRADREFDHRMKRKIDAEIDRFMDKIF